ncbi:hypothetical protein LMG29739_04541 [Paraburkholderia solisilvae]|uniref:RNA polymerase sigma factor 70 region 4 type 2 domain-containing protein n=2 Tax=Paraburkholderia solisilvae TaxID=624376 RepID=A0A6J5EJ64_9BURK|nr:hypothetical protein LMG29739_04541 [Paraburkholderia solisilvae]
MSDKHSFRKEQSLKEGLFHQPNIVDSEESELSDAALRQLLILSDRERVAMLLTAGMGLDYEQASSILNVPVNTVLELIASARIAIGRIVLSAH